MADDQSRWVIEPPAPEEAAPGAGKFAAPAALADPSRRWVIEEGIDTPGHVPAWKSGARGFVQGVTGGLSDEGYGVLTGAKEALTGSGDFVAGYARGRDEERAANKKAHESNPKSYIGGEIGGGLVLPFGAAKLGLTAATEGTLAARSLAAAKEGAAYSGAYGYGKGEGAEDSLVNAAKSAAIGAPIAAALPGAVDLASNLAKRAAAPIRGVLSPTAVGNEKVAEALMRDMQPAKAAAESPTQLLERASDRLARVRQTNPEAMLADVGGENTRNLLRSASNMSSAGGNQLKNALDFRQSNQWRRLERGLEENLANPSEYASSIDNIVAQREAAAKPAFDAAFKVPVKPTDQLVEVLQRPGMQSIMERVRNKMADEGASVASGAASHPPEGASSAFGRDLSSADAASYVGALMKGKGPEFLASLPSKPTPIVSTATLNESPQMIFLHRTKMEIDKAIGEVKRGQSSTAGWDVNTLNTLKRDLVNAIPNPQYKAALKEYAGSSALKNAAEEGFENALKMPTEEISKHLSGLSSDAEREMWRLGASRALAGKIRQGNVMRDRTESIFGSPDMQKRLEGIFPDNESRRQFQRALVIEAKMADTRKAVQGNSTTAKQLAQGDEAGQVARPAIAVANAAVGRLEPAMAYFARQLQRFSGLTPASANAIIQSAMQKSGSAGERAWLDAMRKAEQEPAFRQELVRRLMAGASAGASPEPVVSR